MTIKINSFNSISYPKANFIDCSVEQVCQLTSRAVNIDAILGFDSFEAQIEWAAQRTALSLFYQNTTKFTKFTATSRRTIITLDRSSFLPGHSKIFKPL